MQPRIIMKTSILSAYRSISIIFKRRTLGFAGLFDLRKNLELAKERTSSMNLRRMKTTYGSFEKNWNRCWVVDVCCIISAVPGVVKTSLFIFCIASISLISASKCLSCSSLLSSSSSRTSLTGNWLEWRLFDWIFSFE